jgi:hypothetical protein
LQDLHTEIFFFLAEALDELNGLENAILKAG